MDEITTIINSSRSFDDIISDLKNKSVEVPEWSNLVKDYEPTLHEIVKDNTVLKDKVKSDGTVEKSSRIYIGLEKLLVKRMTEFMFAIPVRRTYHNTEDNEMRQKIEKAIEAIYKYASIDTENIKRGRMYFASCEVFTMWYAVDNANTLYGFNSKYKLKCKTYSPMEGVRLYPLIDEIGDMLAMSFEYSKKLKDEEITYFETYTSDKHYKWAQKGNGWELTLNEPIAILKIPGVYLNREVPIFYGLTNIRKEIEYTLSRNSNVIAYNSAPILKVSGGIKGNEDKGESRRIFRTENGGDVSYVSWAQSIEALKYHVETMTNLFWSQSQIPDISFEKMKSLGNIGFDARRTLLTDAHLKVGDEAGVWIESFERECNVIKAFLKMLNTSWSNEIDNVEVEHTITPFIQNDEDAFVNRLSKLNGGKPIMSQLESIQQAGYSTDAQSTLEQIQKEDKASNAARMNSLFEGAV